MTRKEGLSIPMSITISELDQLKPIVVSVIGPTNEGKTSVLRTLTGDPNFGEVNPLAGTTVFAQQQKVFYRGYEILNLIDTPGFQMSGVILDILENNVELGPGKSYSVEQIIHAIPKNDDHFKHDLRAWREVAGSTMVIYVANVMENPKLSLVQNTLALLPRSKPTIVVFNNVLESEPNGAALSNYRQDWISELHRFGLHQYQAYDAHHRNFLDELDLFEKMIVLTDNPLSRKVLKLEVQERQNRENKRMDDSRQILAQLLIDLTTFQKKERNINEKNRNVLLADLSDALSLEIYQREHDAFISILQAWNFNAGILEKTAFAPKTSVQEATDLFSADAWKSYSSGAKWGGGIGAVIGVTADILSAGLSLGTGTLIGMGLGTLIGAGSNGFYHFNFDKHSKVITVAPQKDVLLLVLARTVQLIRKLQARGKALQDGTQVLVSRTPPLISDKDIETTLDALLKNNNEKNRTTLKEQLLLLLERLLPIID